MPGYARRKGGILAGAPLVGARRGELRFTAPLTATTAAAFDAILNLAVFFAWHTFRRQGTPAAPFAGTFEGVALWK